MPATPWVPTVTKIIDGETVEAATVNPPLDQLIQRDQHLYEKFNELLGKSVLVAFDQPIHPTENITAGTTVVYYKEDLNGSGLAKAITGFSSSNTRSMYAPTSSNFTFGIISSISTSGLAELFIQGLCELPYPMDDPVYGLIEQELPTAETFAVGPYYLSRKYPGKLTKNPAGIPVYVGYALSRTSFLLQPTVAEFSQFFVNYRYNVLDRPTAAPTLTAGTWTLPTGVPATRLGWVAADPSVLPGFVIPTGAKFFYFIPPGATFEADGSSLSADEKIEAAELGAALPPIPANFVQLSVNGVMQRLRDVYTPDGAYTIDQYGLWWFDDLDGTQPWASDLGTGWTPDNWPTAKGSIAYRPRMFLSFSKFNPALRTQLVSSLRPAPGCENLISFVSKDNQALQAATGDLYAKLTPRFTLPAEANSASAVSDLTFDELTGKFVKATTPVVSSLVGVGDITVTDLGSGQYQVGYQNAGITGFVDSIEPVNARLEFIGLNSFIKFPYMATTTVPYAIIGKILLPQGYPITRDLRLSLHLFGSIAGSGTVLFDFQYNVCPVNSVLSPIVSSVSSTTLTLPSGYIANTNQKLTDASLVVPSASLAQDATVNFKLTRKPGTYTGDIGLLGVYWNI